ncbi:MAG: GAF domain-containing protein [Candidatus Cybelea sp.]|jgi:hypothetical protein
MKPAVWRAVIVVLCGITGLLALSELLGATGIDGATPWLGIWGATVSDSRQPFDLTIQSIEPGGASEQGGLRAGDRVDLRANNLLDRFSLTGQPLAGRPVTILVLRDSAQRTAVVTPRPPNLRRRWDAFFNWPGQVWIAVLAALIVWRRSSVREMRLLCLALISYALWQITAPFAFAAPWTWVYVVFRIGTVFFGPLAVAFWATCAGCFGAPLSQARRTFQTLCYVFVAASIALGCAGVLGVVTLWFDPLRVSWLAAGPVFGLALFAALGCGVLAIAASHGIDQRRAAWLLAPPALLFFARYMLDGAATHLHSYDVYLAINYFYSLVLFTTPLVVTYVALSRRLIDIGFVLNRAAVFGIVSAIVIGVFILIEWAASEWLVKASHTTSVVAGMVVALALGLSMRYIHHYVDAFVDGFFFRKRHEDEAALRRFTVESAFIGDRDVLLNRATQEVLEHTNADEATILVRDDARGYVTRGNGSLMRIDPNDPGIIALKAWSKPVNLHSLEDSQLRGELAFPMISRGDLVGALVCGPKRDGEAYAPDESDALLALARGVGTALDTLSPQNGDAIASLQATQGLILDEVRALARRIDGA